MCYYNNINIVNFLNQASSCQVQHSNVHWFFWQLSLAWFNLLNQAVYSHCLISYACLLVFNFLKHLKLTLTLWAWLSLSGACPSLILSCPQPFAYMAKHPLASHACNPKQIPIRLPSFNLPGRLTTSTQASSLSNLFNLIFISWF